MKKIILIILSVIVILGAVYALTMNKGDNAPLSAISNIVKTPDTLTDKNSWTRNYQGLLPCADCGGIMTKLTLNFSPDGNNTYTTVSEYIGKEKPLTETETGTWVFKGDITAGFIALTDSRDGRVYHAKLNLESNKLTYVDENGNIFESSFPYELAEIIEQK
jgi:copper homeostasis protein (lipoprotein)